MQLARPLARATLGAAVALLLLHPATSQERPRLDVPFVPTPQHVVNRMLELADLKPGEFMMDLGSGDGRIAITAAQKYKARAVGVDIDPVRIKEARENAEKAGVSDLVTFRQEDLFKTDISKADAITMYLLETVNLRLRPRLLAELRPGTRLVSHAFSMGEWEPDIRETVDGRTVYFWVVPAQVAGRWKVEADKHAILLSIDQEFQKFTGGAEVNDQRAQIRDGRLQGADIQFTLELDGKPAKFTGRVDGKTMQGESDRGPWKAVKTGA
jgi:precorrin-6B methylase 2